MAPDPFEGNHRQPRAENKYWARTSSTSLVPCSFCSSSSSTEWRTSLLAAATTVTHSANCAVLVCFRCRVNCSDKFQQFLVGYGRPCDPAAGVQGRAILGSTVDTYFASVRGWLYGRISHKFYVKVELQIMRSILASLPANMAEEEVAALVVNGSGMHSIGFAGISALRACSR